MFPPLRVKDPPVLPSALILGLYSPDLAGFLGSQLEGRGRGRLKPRLGAEPLSLELGDPR